jgi:hypothetical protein
MCPAPKVVLLHLKIMLNLGWLGTEQSFLHQRVMLDAKKLDKEQLLEVFEATHQQYLLRSKLFTNLISWCARNGVLLPPLTDLFEDRPVDHPLESEREA